MEEKNASETQTQFPEASASRPAHSVVGLTDVERNDGELGRALRYAKEESLRLGHKFIGSEQLLVGILRQEKQVAAMVLNSLGVSTDKARQEIKQIVGYGRGEVSEDELHFTALTKQVLETAIQEANKLQCAEVRTQHLLLALVANEKGVALQILENLNVDLKRLLFLIDEVEG